MPSDLPSRPPERELPVLRVDADRLEWLASGAAGPVHGFAPLRAPEPEEIAARAAEMAAELGVQVRSCVVALGTEVVTQRVVELPVLPARELTEVLRRRARAALEVESEEVLFHARPYGMPVGPDRKGSDSWTLYVQRRAFVRGLQVALAARGIRARRVVVARSCLVARAQELFGRTEGAFVALAGGPWETLVALVCDGEPWFETVLNTSITLDDPGTQATLVQELRNLGGWWRKSGHGAPLEAVVSIGMEEGLVALLEPALRAALGPVRLLAPEDGLPPGQEALAACRSSAPLVVELGVRPPLRRARVLFAALVVALVGALAAQGLRREVDDRLAFSRDAVAELEGRSARLDEIARREELLRGARAELEACMATLGALHEEGVPLETFLAETQGAFGGLAELLSVAVEPSTGVRLAGVTVADVQLAREALAHLERALERTSTHADVHVVPPTRLPEDGDRPELSFRVESTLEVRP